MAQDGAEALNLIAQRPIQCLLLDVMLPGLSGCEICRQIRETYDLPVLFLSGRDGDMEKIRGLGLGADDYVVKSATPSEVVARIKSVPRRYHRGAPPRAAAEMRFGRLVLDPRARGAHRRTGRPFCR